MSETRTLREGATILERLIESQPPGTIGPRFVKAAGLVAVATAVATKNPNAVKAFLLGTATGTLGNSLSSLVGHRQGAHRSIQTNLGPANEILRAGTGIFGGLRMRAIAMHRWHHDHADTVEDPHAPSIIGRGKIFRGIIGISERFDSEHRDYADKIANESPYTSPRFYEKTPIFLGTLVATHMITGRKLGIPVPYRLASTGLHLALVYTQNAMFTADVHSDDPEEPDTIRRFPYGNTMNIIFGSENGHPSHHTDPSDPRLSQVDAVYGAALIMRRLGLAKIPKLDHIKTNK